MKIILVKITCALFVCGYSLCGPIHVQDLQLNSSQALQVVDLINKICSLQDCSVRYVNNYSIRCMAPSQKTLRRLVSIIAKWDNERMEKGKH